ncbi:MAG: hypothetical protein R3E32_21505 [Chitinophagales bacterium]|jgi:hypothetical protein
MWSNGINGFQVSPYLQELQAYAGQSDNYSAAVCDLEKYLRIETNRSQTERVTKYYASELQSVKPVLPVAQRKLSESLKESVEQEGLVYSMIDGGMLQTREGEKGNDWKEVKLGRIFTDLDHYELDKNHCWLKQSIYAAHLGSHKDFLCKFEPLVDILSPINERLVFVADGAPWIWNWVEESYPKATQILDFYHAAEHLSKFAKLYYKTIEEQKNWLNKQKNALLNDEISVVIKGIEELEKRAQKSEKERNSLLNYLRNNEFRMMYKTFRDTGLFIGSGAIESAHRTVIQKRLKQSGQRWTLDGAQKIIDLRLMNMNQQWHELIKLIQAKELELYKKQA